MSSATKAPRTVSMPLLIAAIATVAVALAVSHYLSLPSAHEASGNEASQETRAYVRNLELSDVTMQATENFMNQQVVEVQGKIANHGPRPLRTVDVYCLFSGINGGEVARQRLSIVQSKTKPLRPGETHPFRLPFDNLPDGWNQAMPKLVIARITFADEK